MLVATGRRGQGDAQGSAVAVPVDSTPYHGRDQQQCLAGRQVAEGLVGDGDGAGGRCDPDTHRIGVFADDAGRQGQAGFCICLG